MLTSILVSLLVALFIGVCVYYVTANFIVAIAFIAAAFFCFAFIVFPLLERYTKRKARRSECASFISAFILSLSATNSIDRAFENGLASCGEEAKRLADSIFDLSAGEKVEYFQAYFDKSIYPMFVSVFHIYQDQGGDILKVASEVMEESSRIELADIAYHKAGVRTYVQFGLMWGLSLLVMVFMRIGLTSFYAYLETSISYLISAIVYFALLLFSFVLFTLRFGEGKLSSLSLKRRKKEGV